MTTPRKPAPPWIYDGKPARQQPKRWPIVVIEQERSGRWVYLSQHKDSLSAQVYLHGWVPFYHEILRQERPPFLIVNRITNQIVETPSLAE